MNQKGKFWKSIKSTTQGFEDLTLTYYVGKSPANTKKNQ